MTHAAAPSPSAAPSTSPSAAPSTSPSAAPERPLGAAGATGPAIVVHGGTLGDLVLTFGVLGALAADGAVWLVAPWSAAQLAARCVPGVTAVDGDQPRWARLYAPSPPPPDAALAAALGAARAVVTFVARPDDPWSHHVAVWAPQAVRAAVAPRPPADWTGHVVEWHRHQLAAQHLALDLAPPPARRAVAGGPIVLHPGSGAQAKCWPSARFAAAADALLGEGHRVQVVLGEAERERWHERELRRWRAAYDVREPASLGALVDVLDDAALFVGNDSGPTQLAAARGVPTVALFGPTPPAWWRPRGAAVTVVAPPAPAAMDWLDVDTVVAAVRRAGAAAPA